MSSATVSKAGSSARSIVPQRADRKGAFQCHSCRTAFHNKNVSSVLLPWAQRSRAGRFKSRKGCIRGSAKEPLTSGVPEKVTDLKLHRSRKNVVIETLVGGTTELLRSLGMGGRANEGSSRESQVTPEVSSLKDIDEVLLALRKDYVDRAYFVTGDITDALYDKDCFFADPTVNFTGRERWKENLRLLVPFLEDPSITLLSIEPVQDADATVISTRWILRTYLKLPWRPYIDVAGGTTHRLNERLQIVEHVERWSVSSLAAIKQIFVPSQRAWP